MAVFAKSGGIVALLLGGLAASAPARSGPAVAPAAAAGITVTAPAASLHERSIAAGWKALTLCSGIFVATRSQAQVEAGELAGGYPQYRALVAQLPATVDTAQEEQSVAVPFTPGLPPRIAGYRRDLGCSLLPPGAPVAAIARLPQLTSTVVRPALDGARWPSGDAVALGPLALRQRPALAHAVAKAFDGGYGKDTATTAVLVLKAGRIIAERYAPGHGEHIPQRTWSVAKSVTATLIGRGKMLDIIDPAEPVGIPEWGAGDPRNLITVAQLMHMASGLQSDGARSDAIYFGGSAVGETATAQPLEAAPGTRFRYANDDALLAAHALRARLGSGSLALAFPYAQLFWKIGMTRTIAETDWRGDYVLSSQLWSTARDLARLALLYEADGVWNGERLLPPGWRATVTARAPAQPVSGPGYGSFFWLYGPREGLPIGSYAMVGNRGQYVMIVPSEQLIVIRRGLDPIGEGATFDIVRFVADTVAAAK